MSNPTAIYGQNILVLIPHPDDEIVGCGAAIARARKLGAKIHGLYLTQGCIPRRQLWPWQRNNLRAYRQRVDDRLREAELAAHVLGIEIFHLERDRAARELWPALPQIFDLIELAVDRLKPDVIWVPAYEGGNPDHDGLNGLAALIPSLLGVRVFEFSEYNFASGKVSAPGFPVTRGTEIELELTGAEIADKRLALAIYESEKGNLVYFAHPVRELFRPLEAYDYARPPHPGKLFYARHQWVPFRHPRVDFTKPRLVSEAILALHRSKAGL